MTNRVEQAVWTPLPCIKPTFRDLKRGDIFRHSGHWYMASAVVHSRYSPVGAVDLTDGTYTYFSSVTSVEPIDTGESVILTPDKV